VDIPKVDGGSRPLGIPTVADRVAQEVVRRYLEPRLEPVFHADSYGYRPGKSAIDAVRQARQRCWRYDWVLDIDVKAYFDSIDWELMLRAVRHHTSCPWVLLYIERWLKVRFSWKMAASCCGHQELLRAGLSVPSWRICSCIMRSICG
jgi:retron-type reverse transcriptase